VNREAEIMSEPKVSAVMCYFNREKYIAETIESVLNQTYKDFEFIIINDGSTDKSKEIVESYARKDDRMILIDNSQNLGISKSRNIGIQASKGKYIWTIDSDDICFPVLLEKEVAAMEADDNIVYCNCDSWRVGDSGKFLRKTFLGYFTKTTLKWSFALGNAITQHGALLRKEAVIQCNGYDENLIICEDYDLWRKLFKMGDFKCIPEFLSKVRMHNKKITNTTELSRKNTDFIKVVKEFQEDLFGEVLADEETLTALAEVTYGQKVENLKVHKLLALLNEVNRRFYSQIDADKTEQDIIYRDCLKRYMKFYFSAKVLAEPKLMYLLITKLLHSILLGQGLFWIEGFSKFKKHTI
jgi:glycosyltransferase involved in cell wall biosynthesis